MAATWQARFLNINRSLDLMKRSVAVSVWAVIRI
jgi:hypothetical protein